MAITDSDERKAFQYYLQGLFEQVDQEAFDRHSEGAAKYGPLKFLGADTLQEALEEVLDLINYARYTAVKLKMLQSIVADAATDVEDSETTGAGQFVSTSELLKGMKQ